MLLLSSLLILDLLLLLAYDPYSLVLGATKGLPVQDATFQPPPTINMKFRIYGIDLIKQGVVVFITADNLSKARIINSGDIALLSKVSAGKIIASGFSLPRYLVHEGDKIRVCIMELQTVKVVCALSEYNSGDAVTNYIDIFMNSSKAFYPVPNVWRSIY
jgi:hypothetical protein